MPDKSLVKTSSHFSGSEVFVFTELRLSPKHDFNDFFMRVLNRKNATKNTKYQSKLIFSKQYWQFFD